MMESVPGAVSDRVSTYAMVEIAQTVTRSLPLPVLTSSAAISVHSFDHRRVQLCKRPDVAHAVPGIKIAWWFSFRLIAFEKARHEEFLR